MTDEPPDQVDTELALLRSRNAELEVSLVEARRDADRRLIQLDLKAEAVRAGMIDLDGLKLIDAAEVTVDDEGHVRGAAAVISRMRRDKPWLFPTQNSSSAASVPSQATNRPKLATEMTLDEWRAARAELVRRR